MNQDVMEQARNTNTTGQPDSWNTPANNGGMSPFQKQSMAKSLMNMGGRGSYQKPEELKMIKAQNPFVQVSENLPIQDKKDEQEVLAELLRNYNG